jgi:Skp family chaperone for outer membrane proteins
MKGRLIWFVTMAALGGLALGMLSAGTQVAPAPLKVGVVDLSRVADAYQKRKDREADLNTRRDAAAAQLKELQKKVEALSSEIELLDKNGPQYAAKKRQLIEKQEELLMKARLADREVLEKMEQYLQEVYSEILAKVSEYRDRNHFDFIFRLDTRPLSTQERIADQLDRKLLLSSAKAFDITEDMILFVNQPQPK